MASEQQEIKAGDVVRLKSGGPKMTTLGESITTSSATHHDCVCYEPSPDGSPGKFHYITLPPAALVKVS